MSIIIPLITPIEQMRMRGQTSPGCPVCGTINLTPLHDAGTELCHDLMLSASGEVYCLDCAASQPEEVEADWCRRCQRRLQEVVR